MISESGQFFQVNRSGLFPDIIPCRKQRGIFKAARPPSFRLVELLPVIREQFPEIRTEFFRLQILVDRALSRNK